MAIIKTINNKCWIKFGEKGTLIQLLLKADDVTMENSMEIVPKIKNISPSYSILGIYLKNMKTPIWKYICTLVFIAALFTVARIWKWTACTLMDEWVNMMRCIYTMGYYSVIKKALRFFHLEHGYLLKMLDLPNSSFGFL